MGLFSWLFGKKKEEVPIPVKHEVVSPQDPTPPKLKVYGEKLFGQEGKAITWVVRVYFPVKGVYNYLEEEGKEGNMKIAKRKAQASYDKLMKEKGEE